MLIPRQRFLMCVGQYQSATRRTKKQTMYVPMKRREEHDLGARNNHIPSFAREMGIPIFTEVVAGECDMLDRTLLPETGCPAR